MLQKVAAIFPTSAKDLWVLESYQEVMGCDGLFGAPWAFQSKSLTVELLMLAPNQYDKQIRAHPERWTADVWKETYNFREGEVKTAERVDEFLKGEFVWTADPKDGYVIDNLRSRTPG